MRLHNSRLAPWLLPTVFACADSEPGHRGDAAAVSVSDAGESSHLLADASQSVVRVADAAADAGAGVSAELAAALDPSGYRNDERRVELVVGALCNQRAACGVVANADQCRATYRVDWRNRVAEGKGVHVPCHDALLDTISCLATAACDSQSSCDALVRRQDTVCSQGPTPSTCGEWVPSAPLPGSDAGTPTKGPIPPEAHLPGGRGLDWTLVPDFVGAWAPDGSLAGYVRKQDLMDPGCETKTVVDETLTRVVGHMVPGVGFVALSAGR